MSLTPRDALIEAVNNNTGFDCDMYPEWADAVLAALSRAGFALVPRPLLESAADALENEWPNGGDNPGMRAAGAMRAILNAHQEPTP